MNGDPTFVQSHLPFNTRFFVPGGKTELIFAAAEASISENAVSKTCVRAGSRMEVLSLEEEHVRKRQLQLEQVKVAASAVNEQEQEMDRLKVRLKEFSRNLREKETELANLASLRGYTPAKTPQHIELEEKLLGLQTKLAKIEAATEKMNEVVKARRREKQQLERILRADLEFRQRPANISVRVMHILHHTNGQVQHTMLLRGDYSTLDLAVLVERATGIRVCHQRLVHHGIYLQLGRTISSYGISTGDEITLIHLTLPRDEEDFNFYSAVKEQYL